MWKLPVFPHLAATAALIGLAALLGSASDTRDQGRIVLKAPVLASADGEAAVNPVDLDGDGIDDSAAFAAALAEAVEPMSRDVAPVPRAKPQPADRLVVLRLKTFPCAEVVAHKSVPDLDAPVKRVFEKTPWVLLAGSDDTPNAKGKELRVLGQPVLTKGSSALVVAADDNTVPESAIPIGTLPKGCVAEPTVS